MQHLSAVLRTSLRWFFAVSAFWLAARGAWLLMLFGRAAAHPSGLAVGLILGCGGAWQWLGSLESRHRSILEKHRTRIRTPKSVEPKPIEKKRLASAPKASAPVPGTLVAQPG
jgi:hypothetical protein